MHYPAVYPSSADARDRFVLELRGARPAHDPWRYQHLIVEDERTEADPPRPARVGTIILTGRECPWRCVMCDLWRGTTADDTPRGAIPAQIAAAWRELDRRGERVSRVKLYNAGSFFDPRAVPESDYDAIAVQLAAVDRVIVESHPSLVGQRVDRFLAALAGPGDCGLEVAMGLETANHEALAALNKDMDVEDFAAAADYLRRRDVALRAFLLVSPPGVPDDEQDGWLLQSIDVAYRSGARVVSLVPTRSGNGALDALAAAGAFRQPRLDDIERSFDQALRQRRLDLRLFVDVWDLARFSTCARCLRARHDRLHLMNLEQRVLPRVECRNCDGQAG